MDWKVSEYLEMREVGFDIPILVKGILMALDKYAPADYFPPVPMDVGTFYFLRRN